MREKLHRIKLIRLTRKQRWDFFGRFKTVCDLTEVFLILIFSISQFTNTNLTLHADRKYCGAVLELAVSNDSVVNLYG